MDKEKIKNWLKNKENFIFILVLAFSVVLGIYYLIHTRNQPLWWDEADYLSIAKHWAFGAPYDVTAHRPLVLPLVSAIVFMLGLGISTLKFIFGFLPFVGSVIMIYLLCAKYINRKVGVVASIMTATSWILIFIAMRVFVDMLMVFLTLATIYVFLDGYENGSSKKMVIAGALLGFAFITKFTLALFVFVLFGYILLTSRLSAFKKKEVYAFSFAALGVLAIYLIYAQYAFGSFLLPFLEGSHVIQNAVGTSTAGLGTIKLSNFMLYEQLLLLPFFIFFLIGLPISMKYLLYIDKVVKDYKAFKSESFKFLLTILLVVSIIFFIFINRLIEHRYIYPFAIIMVVAASEGIVWIYEKIKKYQKTIAITALLLMVGIGVYSNINYGYSMIQMKVDSYAQVRDAGEWLKLNSPPDSVILSISRPQMSFYSERKVISFSTLNYTSMSALVAKEKPDYLMISAYEYHAPWVNSWVNDNQKLLETANVYYINEQPSVVIFKFKH